MRVERIAAVVAVKPLLHKSIATGLMGRMFYVYAIPPGSPLVPPNQLPEAYNTLHELRAELRHRLSRQLAASVSYAFENFKVYDFAMDPTVVDGIVQPSSLVLGYVYRPYTTHSAVVSLLYSW